MADNQNEKKSPYFGLGKAKTMINKRVLIGVTYYDHKGAFIEQKQMHGRIISVDSRHGFEIELEGARKGDIYWVPPDVRSFREAKPGDYRERSTGEIINNPDFLSTWEVYKPPPDFKSDS